MGQGFQPEVCIGEALAQLFHVLIDPPRLFEQGTGDQFAHGNQDFTCDGMEDILGSPGSQK
jgi:hypothetical protein